MQSREFKHSGAALPDLNGSRLCRKLSDYGAQKLSSSQESFHSKLRAPTILAPQMADGKNENSQQAFIKDIRDATTVREVREIMNQVKSKYRNSSSTKASSITRQNTSGIYDNIRI